MLCAQKWKTAPEQLPIWAEAGSGMWLTGKGRKQQLGAGSGAAGTLGTVSGAQV